MNRAIAVLVGIVTTLAGAAAEAQPRERHHGGFGPWQFHHHHHYGAGPWRETYRTVVPAETVVPMETVVPTETVVVTPSVAPSVSTTATIRRNTLPYTGPGVTILLPQETGGEVTYLVDGREEVVIHAGQEQTLPKKGSYDIRFSRGQTDDGRDFGIARYTITEGTYAFEVTDHGWDLYRQRDVEAGPGVSTVTSPTVRTNAIPARPTTPRSASAPSSGAGG